MKKLANSAPQLLAVLFLLIPATDALLSVLSFDMILTSPNAIMTVLGLLAAGLVILCRFVGKPANLPILPVCAAACTLWFLSNCNCSMPSVLFGLECLICTSAAGRPSFDSCLARALRLLFWILLVAILLVLALIGSSFNRYYTFPELPSPGDTKIAAVTIVDQGALGGNTVVDVYRSGETDLGFLKIRRFAAETLLTGWVEPETLQVGWLDDHTLLVNGEEYIIDP